MRHLAVTLLSVTLAGCAAQGRGGAIRPPAELADRRRHRGREEGIHSGAAVGLEGGPRAVCRQLQHLGSAGEPVFPEGELLLHGRAVGAPLSVAVHDGLLEPVQSAVLASGVSDHRAVWTRLKLREDLGCIKIGA